MSRHKLIGCAVLAVLCLTHAVAAQETPPNEKPVSVSPTGAGADVSKSRPEEFERLYEKVKKDFTRDELKVLLRKMETTGLESLYMEKLEFLASPVSIQMQKQQHTDWIPLLVNDETLSRGVSFFQKHEDALRRAYQETGVHPRDIIAILNWESKLGETRGSYVVFKVFWGQIFCIDEVEGSLFRKGAYDAKGAMPRDEALKRVERLKSRAVENLGELLLQTKSLGVDPYAVMGSWAGAIGIPQFMPASMIYAADGDGDGVIDLNTLDDAILSVANYLQKNGYHSRGAAYAFRRYNRDKEYVRGVSLYSEEVEKRGVRTPANWVYRKKTGSN